MAILEAFAPHFALSGLLVGMLVGMTGVGGGSLMTPLLVLLFGVHPATAVGTDLLFAAITKSAGTLVHGRIGTIDWRVVGRLAAGSVPGALATLGILALLGGAGADTGRTIAYALGWALLATAAALLLRGRLMLLVDRWRREKPSDPRLITLLTIIFGLVLGVLVTLSSVGAGAIGVTVLILLYPRLPTAQVVGSDIVHAVPLTLVAGTGYWLIGAVDWVMLASLLAGSIPGILVGSMLSPRIPDRALRPVLAGVLGLVGAKLVLA